MISEVAVAGESREVSEVAVEGSEVRLTLVSPAEVVKHHSQLRGGSGVGRVSGSRPGRKPGRGVRGASGGDRSGDALPARAVRQIQAILEAKQRRTPAQKKMDSQLLEEWQKAAGPPGSGPEGDGRSPGRGDPGGAGAHPGTGRQGAQQRRALPGHPGGDAALRGRGAGRPRGGPVHPHRRQGDDPQPAPEAFPRPPGRHIERRVPHHPGDVAHRANTARTTHSVDGTGIGIGVISDGIGTLAARQATGDLPARVTVLEHQHGEGQEGTAMLEIVHDLAPGADLYFATAFGGMAAFGENIEALCEAGADIIVDDVYYFWKRLSRTMSSRRGSTPQWPTAASSSRRGGNAGNKNDGTAGVWEGDFAAGSPLILNNVTVGTQHDFGSGVTQNRITADSPGGFVLWWADPLEGSANDYDLFMVDENGDVVRSSTRIQDGTLDPYEYISSGSDDHTGNRLVIVKVSGAADRYLRLDTLEGQLAISTAGQLFGHSAAENAIAVAAVAVQNAGGGRRCLRRHRVGAHRQLGRAPSDLL